MEAASGGFLSRFLKWKRGFSRVYQHHLDRLIPHTLGRWTWTLGIVMVYLFRVWRLRGFCMVSYGLGLYVVNLGVGFLSPLAELGEGGAGDGMALPVGGSEEFKPFLRKLPEFKFWYSMTKAFILALVMTFFRIFDVPAYWPILLTYWMILFILSMGSRIRHMIKHKYIPFNLGKKKYPGKKAGVESV